ncbi:hypothetical protein ACHAXR_006278, partial [Thalassiosira sp. AJA248-18]
IQKRSLKGHRKPVLCLAHSSERLAYYPDSVHHSSLLLSGSEDGTARLWDLRMRKTALCMMVPRAENEDCNDVTSVAFHPSIVEERQKDAMNDDMCKEDSTNALLPIQHDCTVYASTANNVYGYDLRHHSTTSTVPIIKTPHFDLSPSFQCSDEINQLSFSFPKRNGVGGSYFMSAADDSGEAHVVADGLSHRYEHQSLKANAARNHKTFSHAEPETMAITSSAVFQPRTNNDSYLATGGTDCTVKLWDASRPRRPTSNVQIKPAESENTTQLCNPPYVHSLSWSPSGRLLCAGIGDGSCAILRAEGRRLVEIGRMGSDEGGHGSAVAAVCFAGFGLCERGELSTQLPTKVRKSGEAEDRLMISAGNDGNIIFWDLGGNMVGSGPLDPALYLAKYLSSSEVKQKGKKDDSSEDDFPEELMPSPPKVLFQIAHRQKPNWITCSRASDAVLPTSLFLADTTNNISVYTLPL